MKKIIFALAVLFAFSVFSINVHAALPPSAFNITFIGQDPSPATPGGYIDLTFKARGGQSYGPSDVTFAIAEKFPFSLAPGESKTRNLGDIQAIGTASINNDILFSVKLLVDSKATDGDSELEYQYYIGSAVYSQKIKISVSGVQTDFDVIAQEVSGHTVSLGVVNTGKNSAKSVVISIPEQQFFQTENINSNIIGNLASGDFTVATFKLNPLTNEQKGLDVIVSYTDTVGARHDSKKTVPLKLGTDESIVSNVSKSSFGSGSVLTIILVLIIIGLAYLAFFKKSGK